MTRRGLGWLSEAADMPDRCREVWADDPRRPYALPAGRNFDVVVLEQRVGTETFDQLGRHGLPVGPVMADRATRQVGFFVPTGSRELFERTLTAESLDPPGYRYLTAGTIVVTPGPMPLSGDRYTWLRAPATPLEATPAQTAALAAMCVAAHELVQRADRYGEQRTRPAVPRHATANGAEGGAP